MATGEQGSEVRTTRPSRPDRGAPILPQSFYARDALVVARDLLGKLLRREGVVLRITEVEAYCHPNDTANHCRAGRTERNAAMWGPPGHAYVYLCYGIHHMLNIVTDGEGEGAAVLIRACEPVAGVPEIVRRRGGKLPRGRYTPAPVLLTGPGKVGQALALDPDWSHHPLFVPGGLTIHDAPAVADVLAGPRVGIDFAAPADVEAPWRLAIADSPWVTVRSELRRV
jgi:DNA-3-methyladenine glycosylase